jgi:hypothetical protein
MLMVRFIQFLCISVILAGCATVPPHGLSSTDVSSLKINEIKAVLGQANAVSWPDYAFELSFSSSAAAPSLDPAVTPPPAVPPEDINRRVQETVLRNMESAVRGQLPVLPDAKRPARIVVTVTAVQIPSAVQRILFGGAPELQASAVVTDAKTNAVLATYPVSRATAYAGQGIGGTLIDRAITGQTNQYDRVADAWSGSFRRWFYSDTPH